MKIHLSKRLLSASLMALPLCATAEDIDLFISPPPATSADAPNVLLILDNGANFSASVAGSVCKISADGEQVSTNPASSVPATALSGMAAGVEQCALYSVIKDLRDQITSDVVSFNIGVMVFNANGLMSVNPTTTSLSFENRCRINNSSNGGCLVYPIAQLTRANANKMLQWIRNWQVSGNSEYVIKGNNASNGAAMQEAWAYLTGNVGLSGRDYAIAKPGASCRNAVIFIGNAYRNNSKPGDATGNAGPKWAIEGTNTANSRMNALPSASDEEKQVVTGVVDIAPYCGGSTSLATTENSGVYALNWGRYMKDKGVATTYSIGVLGPTCNAEYAGHLKTLGKTEIGGGKFYPTQSSVELTDALKKILGEVQTVNSVFAAVSLPISVNTQGTYLNQVYVGMFRPDKDLLPRWDGNLKQYRLGLVNNDLKLLDADKDTESTINPNTGFITECARSYWTPKTLDSYWNGSEKSRGGCLTIANSEFSNYPDGNIVEKGAQAYTLRQLTPASRTVKTCSPVFATCGTTSTLTAFNTTNTAITQTMLDPTSGATNRDTLINWVRGLNLSNELSKGTTAMRPSVHGDVVHSRPVAINYGTDAAPQVVVFYGGNDGMLRAVNGNRGSATNTNDGSITSGGGTYAAGTELWSFMPPEFYGNIKRLYDNTVAVNYKGSAISDAQPKPYGFDGPITAFQGKIANTQQVYVYASMRRGGRALYAFDATTPASPTMKWKKGCPNNFPASGAVSDVDCSTGFSRIGQTWASAKTLFASGHESGSSPLLIMGGGYDTCEDTDNGTVNNSCTSATKGNRIYVLDANDGTLLRELNTDRSVTGDVTIVRDVVTGMAKYAYAADLGGNIYRISGVNANTPFEATAPSGWTITKIASLGCDTVDGCSANRKFMYGPDVVYDNGLYVLLIGSGDREKPLRNYAATYGVANHYFMIKDDPSNADWLRSEAGNCGGTSVICKSSLFGITDNTTPAQESLDAKKGWYLALAAHEQVVTTSVTVFGTVTFSTHQPAVPQPGSCSSNLGTALVYNIAYSNAASRNGTVNRYERIAGDGLPPSPVAGQVTLDNKQTVPFCIGCSPDSPLEGKLKTKPATSSASQYKSRIYWYIQ